MENDEVEYGFRPTDEELIVYYLKNKNMDRLWLVTAIREIIICAQDPEYLPAMSKIQPKDPVWYFFYPIEYKTPKKPAVERTTPKERPVKRTTPSGFWKSTGKDRIIKSERRNRVEIGVKKTLVFYYHGRVPEIPWVIHEYHITCLPSHLNETYAICKLRYRGEDANIFLVYNSTVPTSITPRARNTAREVEQPVQGNLDGLPIPEPQQAELPTCEGFDPNTAPEVEQPVNENLDDAFLVDCLYPMLEQEELPPVDGFNPNSALEPVHKELPLGDGSDPNTCLREPNNHNNLNLPPQTPYDDEFVDRLLRSKGGDSEDEFSYLELIMQTYNNDHRPKKPLSGSISSDSDSDTERTSGLSYQGTSSPGHSVGSTDSCKDLHISADPSTNRKNKESQLTICTIPSIQEVKECKAPGASTDKKLPSMVKTEKKGGFVTGEAMKRNRKNPPCIHLMNMIVGLFHKQKKRT